jgi:Raf kinase inhibitor-like YbhB/YbcL family protein
MKTSVRTTAIAAAVAATLTVATAAAAATQTVTFGYHSVRSDIPSGARTFTVTSPDIANGKPMPAAAYADGFGCTGGNQAPRLRWSGAPSGTKSYAVTMYDPDAPTGSGFWHWLNWDIAGTSLPAADAVAGANDAGAAGYQGPCPPAGDHVHRYQVTVLALDTPSLDLPASTPPAYASFAMSGHILAYARITATAKR